MTRDARQSVHSRHGVIAYLLIVLALMTTSGCSDDEPEKQPRNQAQAEAPRQTIVVQVPASQWPVPVQPPAAPPVQAPQTADGNPWAVQSGGRSHGRERPREWGQPQPRQQPRYVQPSVNERYRPLEPRKDNRATPAPTRQPVQSYRPVAPYDRLSGSSFGTPDYPYGVPYPGYYGPGAYMAPGGVYGPGWPGPVPGPAWPPAYW